jgi:hypothetical protein
MITSVRITLTGSAVRKTPVNIHGGIILKEASNEK